MSQPNDPIPPVRRGRDNASLVWGLVLVVIGGWFFLDHTLGLTLPRIAWGQLWPLVLIAIGGYLLLRRQLDTRR